MEPGNTNDRQQIITSMKRMIFISVFVGIILFLLALSSFLQGGWFVLLGVILLVALCVVVGYIFFCLIMTYAVKKAKTVEIADPTPGKRGHGTFSLTFGKKYDPNIPVGTRYDPNHSDVD